MESIITLRCPRQIWLRSVRWNTKDYLVTEKGIDASRISVRTGNAGTNEVEDYLVPSGANFDNDVPGTTAVDESTVKAQTRKPLGTKPTPHHHHQAAPAATPPPASNQ